MCKYTKIRSGIIVFEKISKFAEKYCSLLDTKVSRSPIIQDGKMVGAVTHVFVNDATKGYGIFIENMLGIEKCRTEMK